MSEEIHLLFSLDLMTVVCHPEPSLHFTIN